MLLPVLLLFAQADLGALRPERVVTLAATLDHVQGIDTDGTLLWVTSVDRAAKKGWLHEFRLPSAELVRAVELTDGVRYHPGGLMAGQSSLWIPVAEYRRNSSAVIQQRSRKTLALESQFTVSDHIGCLAVTGKTIIGGNWDALTLYEWDRAGKLVRTVPNTTGNAFQDLKFSNGGLIASGLLKDRTGAVDWLSWPALEPQRRITAGNTDRGFIYTHEGMTVHNDRLYLLPEDGPSRLFIFKIDPTPNRKPPSK